MYRLCCSNTWNWTFVHATIYNGSHMISYRGGVDFPELVIFISNETSSNIEIYSYSEAAGI